MLVGLLLSPAVPGAEPYTLGAGDRVRIEVYAQDDLDTEAQVGSDGRITMPLLGRIEVAGLTVAEASNLIDRQLEEQGYLRNAYVNLLVERYHSRSVAVLGAVDEPQRLSLMGPTTLAEAIARAGGVTDAAGDEVVLVRVDKADQQSRRSYRLGALLDEGAEGRTPVRVRDGDTVFVPRTEFFFVRGEVDEPGRYALDGPVTVDQAIAISGGFADGAAHDSLTIRRSTGERTHETVEVDPDERLQPGDVLMVEERVF